jgi:hypothetical protein
MKIIISESIRTTKLPDGTSSDNIWTVLGSVVAPGHPQFQVICNPLEPPLGNSRATVEANGVRVEARHHATCKGLRLEAQEVGVEHVNTTSEGSLYLITVL